MTGIKEGVTIKSELYAGFLINPTAATNQESRKTTALMDLIYYKYNL